jgi:hypothetical protein
MAERQQQEMGFGMTAVLAAASIAAAAANRVKGFFSALFADGTLEAAGRMGLDELGEALKPFHDSISVQESGTIWNPTQGEIAAGRESQNGQGGQGFQPMTPGQIAAANRHTPYVPEQDRSDEHRRDI